LSAVIRGGAPTHPVHNATVVASDPHPVEDIMRNGPVRTPARWSRVSRLDAPEPHVKRTVVNEFLYWRSRPLDLTCPTSYWPGCDRPRSTHTPWRWVPAPASAYAVHTRRGGNSIVTASGNSERTCREYLSSPREGRHLAALQSTNSPREIGSPDAFAASDSAMPASRCGSIPRRARPSFPQGSVPPGTGHPR
jgi:hypothetical protein